MENVVEALKIAFAVMMFVMALSLSVFSFSKANSAVTAIINMRDRETEYTYVNPIEKSGQTSSYVRTVGVEDIVPTLYRAYQTNFEIYFLKADGTPLEIYEKIDGEMTHHIDGSEVFASLEESMQHLNEILEGKNGADGLYKILSGKRFIEELGEYYQNDSENTPEANKVIKRVITYTLTNG